MRDPVAEVMDARLAALMDVWRREYRSGEGDADPLAAFADHIANLLVIEFEGEHSRYGHYGQAFIHQFGVDLSGHCLDVLPPDIMPSELRRMLEFEYGFAGRVRRPLWRSYTAAFRNGDVQTWQRLVLPAGQGRLLVGAYPVPSRDAADLDVNRAADLLRMVIERVPVVLDEDGQIRDLALSLQDFGEARQHVAELEILATTDELTGTCNLRQFQRLATLELEHARRMGRAFSLLALDIDHFKRINDSWGHAAGDAALQTFVDACRIALREPDILGRCGGEEFAVALPNTGVEGARIIAERLRYQVEQIQVPLVQGGVFSFTVSVGVATASPTNAYWAGASLSSLMAGADAALYRSKANGRNRVTEADAPG